MTSYAIFRYKNYFISMNLDSNDSFVIDNLLLLYYYNTRVS